MLGKLMKYEIKATSRMFLPLYGALIVLALINKVFFSFGIFNSIDHALLSRFSDIPKTLALTAYIFIIIAIFIITVIVMFQRFYKNLLGDEGYLMFTLPVKPWMNIVNKLVVSVMWVILSSVITLISIFILMVNGDLIRAIPEAIVMTVRALNTELGVNAGLFLTEMAITIFVGLFVNILQVYAAIALGQLCNSHKLLASFGAYLGINIVSQTVASVFMVLSMMINPTWMNTVSPGYMMNLFLIGGTILNLIFGAAFYFITHFILTKKLNLE
ncbi:hypothetical protein [Hydrogenoanaerobacterium sp.]|uniref:hypothetical protein n=1 Tax=Hydrogenoanaerobacterium sp. TaxID=2953763 RepID=UPI002897FBA7|nr:hypothetical protein [Hydrogenoanaerobacterium sp.]